ncbi:hypothetical protein ACWCPT_23075 [Streptomyces sp. NPDC002308]
MSWGQLRIGPPRASTHPSGSSASSPLMLSSIRGADPLHLALVFGIDE